MRGDEEDELGLNPTIELKLVAQWRARGAGRKVMTVEDTELLGFFGQVLSAKSLGEGAISLSPALLQKLREQKLLVLPEEAPQQPALSLDLPDALPELFPRHALGEGAGERELVLSEDLHVQAEAELPVALRGRVTQTAALPPGRPLLWVDDPGTRVLTPYGLASNAGEAVLALLAGRAAPSALSSRTRDVLAAGAILVSPGYRTTRAAEWERRVRAGAEGYEARGHAILRGALNPLQLGLVRPYLRSLEREGVLSHDAQVKDDRRLSMNREPLCELLHEQVVSLVSRVLRAAIKRTYSFFGIYLPGAILARHQDRPQCRWNVSLVLDGDPESGEADAWPLYFEHRGEVHSARLGLGDAVIYSGTDTPHWRDAHDRWKRTAAAFFHFVPPDFDGTVD